MFYFTDYDENLNVDIDMPPDAYIALLDTCFQYSSFFSLSFHSNRHFLEFPGPKPLIDRLYPSKFTNYSYAAFYKCTDVTMQFLNTRAHSIWDWDINVRSNPENLVFYRADASVFFWSETHEGWCGIYNRSYEDILSAVSYYGWKDSASIHPYGCITETESIEDNYIKKHYSLSINDINNAMVKTE